MIEVWRRAVGKTVIDVERHNYVIVMVFADGTRLRMWPWDEYGREGAGMSAEWLASEQEIPTEPATEHRKPLTPRPDWKMPDPPCDVCPDCGDKIEPQAVNTGDSWYLCWDCEKACNAEELIYSIIYWPFEVDDYADGHDLEPLGFYVV